MKPAYRTRLTTLEKRMKSPTRIGSTDYGLKSLETRASSGTYNGITMKYFISYYSVNIGRLI